MPITHTTNNWQSPASRLFNQLNYENVRLHGTTFTHIERDVLLSIINDLRTTILASSPPSHDEPGLWARKIECPNPEASK